MVQHNTGIEEECAKGVQHEHAMRPLHIAEQAAWRGYSYFAQLKIA
jgi:hypothetical protein